MFGKTATLMKFEGVSCSKLQICIFFYKKPEPSCPTDPPRSISRHKLVPVEEIFRWIFNVLYFVQPMALQHKSLLIWAFPKLFHKVFYS